MKKSTLLVVLLVFVFVGALFAGQQQVKKNFGILLPKTFSDGKNEGVTIPITEKEAKTMLKSPKAVLAKINQFAGIIDTLETVVGRGYPYFGGDPGDTFAIYFKPGAGCKVLKIGFNVGYWTNDPVNPLCDGVNVSLHYARYDGKSEPGGGGKYLLGEWVENTWVPTDWYSANYPDPPVGQLFWGPWPQSIIADPADAWEEIETSWFAGEAADNLGHDFVMSLVAYGADGTSVGFEDWQTDFPSDKRLWKYYISDHKWYVRHSVAFAAYAIVEFYENTPPVVTQIGTYPTVLSDDPRTLMCHIVDIDANDENQAGVASAKISYKVNDGDWTDVDMTMVSGTDTDGDWEGTIPGGVLTPGDVLTYKFVATDKAGLTSETAELSYGYFQKSAEILVFYNDDGTSYPSWILSPYYDNLWVKDTTKFAYDVWVGASDGALSSALVNQYNYIVQIDAYSPKTLNDDVIGNWFASGTKYMFWSSQEWAGQFLGGWSADHDTTFAADDWHNQFMGIEYAGGAGHDIATDPFNIDPVAGDVISGGLYDFLGDSLDLYINTLYELGWSNWSDAITPNSNAVVCFTDSAQGRAMGIHNESNGSKTVFLGFDQLCLDTGALPTYTVTDGYHWTEPNVHSVVGAALNWFGAPTDVNDNFEANVAMKYDLSQNYPNPFNPETRITYTIAQPGQVKLTVYNVIGQKVATLVDEYKAANTYHVTFDANNLTSGVYFYRLEVGDYTKTMKMMLLR